MNSYEYTDLAAANRVIREFQAGYRKLLDIEIRDVNWTTKQYQRGFAHGWNHCRDEMRDILKGMWV